MPSKFSRRLSVHRTGQPTLCASPATTSCSGYTPPLAPKPPPIQGARHAHALGVEPERPRNVGSDAEHRLGRCPDRERSVRLGNRDATVRLHGDGRYPLVVHERSYDDIGVGEEAVVRLARPLTDEIRAVRREEQGRAVGGGRDRIGDGGKRVDLHGDFLGGVERLRQRFAEHDRHRLSDEAHPVDREQGPPERFVTREGALAGEVEIGGGPHRVDAVTLGRRVGMDGFHHPVGHVGSDEDRVQRALDLEVGHEAGAAREEARVLRPQHRVTENRPRHEEDVNVRD